MRVLADIDEADVGRLKEKMEAEVTVDAFPGEKFKGTVQQVRYSPTNVSGVVTYAAVVEVREPRREAPAGHDGDGDDPIGQGEGHVRASPNAALRFKPSPPVDKDGKKLVPQDPLPPLQPGQGRLYVLTDEQARRREDRGRASSSVGITDGINTVLKTDLGDAKVVTDETDEASKPKSTRGRMF
jgi:HlyD family secretion protein